MGHHLGEQPRLPPRLQPRRSAARSSSAYLYYPPLVYWVTDVFYAALGSEAMWVAVLSNVVWLAILVFATYGIGRTAVERSRRLAVRRLRRHGADDRQLVEGVHARRAADRGRRAGAVPPRSAPTASRTAGTHCSSESPAAAGCSSSGRSRSCSRFPSAARCRDRARRSSPATSFRPAAQPRRRGGAHVRHRGHVVRPQLRATSSAASRYYSGPEGVDARESAGREPRVRALVPLEPAQHAALPACRSSSCSSGSCSASASASSRRATSTRILMVVGTYVTFTLLRHKDPRYTLPMLPALAVVATSWLEYVAARARAWIADRLRRLRRGRVPRDQLRDVAAAEERRPSTSRRRASARATSPSSASTATSSGRPPTRTGIRPIRSRRCRALPRSQRSLRLSRAATRSGSTCTGSTTTRLRYDVARGRRPTRALPASSVARRTATPPGFITARDAGTCPTAERSRSTNELSHDLRGTCSSPARHAWRRGTVTRPSRGRDQDLVPLGGSARRHARGDRSATGATT